MKSPYKSPANKEDIMGIEDRDYMRERARSRITSPKSQTLSPKTKGWIMWAVIFFPLMILSQGAARAWGWGTVLAIIIPFAIVTMLVSRYVMGRSWHAILWGDSE